MKLCLKILAIAVIAVSTYSLIGCAAPPSFSYQNVTASISAQCADCLNFGITVVYNPAFPAPPSNQSVAYMPPGGGPGGVSIFTVSVNNAPANNITWTIYPQPNLTGINTPPTGTTYPVGESNALSTVGLLLATSGATAEYQSPNGSPVYSGAALLQAQAMGIPQGDVLLVASVPIDPGNPSNVLNVPQLVQIVNSSSPTPYLTPHTNTTPASITAPAVTVARNASFQFTGGAVGAPPCSSPSTCSAIGISVVNTSDNSVLWEVCTQPFTAASCVLNGNTTLGTITQTGLYTAPAAIPSPQPVVIVLSRVAPTITNTSNWANVAVN